MESYTTVVALSVLGPVVGSALGVLRDPTERLMYNLLSFSAGVMVAISFLQLIPESLRLASVPSCVAGLVGGALLMYGLDRLIPHIHPELCEQEQGSNLKKTATYLLLGIFLHNFPEGLAIAVGTIAPGKGALVIALAIAVQKIPEGICTSAPYYHITRKRGRSFLVSASTAIPILAGFYAGKELYRYLPLGLVGAITGSTAGIMIYISADELIPSSCNKLSNHSTIFSLIAGVVLVVLLGGV